MTDEDCIAAKLKGYNVLVKFIDGEELFLNIKEVGESPDVEHEWFEDTERFINNIDEYFPAARIALTRTTVKYVRAL